ncbi:phage tail protein [Hydrogenophaga sp.]|uniref:phage tail protein n=1 Tax=Hydrogenophaga sp. TaxID=1904254 RepID=UPI0035AFBFE7
MPFFLSPIANDQIFDSAGDPLVGGQVETYLAGSSTPAATYTSDTGLVQNGNPIILNALGYAPNAVWLSSGVAYKIIIKNADGAVLRTIDNVAGINDASVSQSQWVQSGLTPTYISATSFSLVGDQTAIFQVGRRLETLNTSGLIYSTIDTSTFAAGVTTITLVNDSGTLDSGLTQVSYGLLSADNSSFPFALLGPANTIALSDDGTTNAAHYLTFADGTAGQENLKTDTAKLAYNPSTGDLTGQAQVGDVKYTARNTAPAGWLKANGAAVSRTTYAALFAAIGTTYGSGNGSTTFNLPDLRGEFIRGWDDARGADPGRVFGSFQSGDIQSHAHGITNMRVAGSGVSSGVNIAPYEAAGGTVVTTTSGGTETRPRNVALLAVIKY